MKILHLTLHQSAYEVMHSGEKDFEIRRPSVWIKSRLFFANGTPKSYDAVKFTNGYGPNRPFFLAEYKGAHLIAAATQRIFSNGLIVNSLPGDYVIVLGEKLK